MRSGFFSASTLTQSSRPQSRIPKCGACGLYKLCKSPKMPPSGHGERRILVIAEAPGKEEDARGVQLVGNSGQYLSKVMRKLGVDMREDCWLTNAVICRPPKNETPDGNKINYCRPNLIQTIEQLKPEIVIPLGGSAVKSLMPYLWKEKSGSDKTKGGGISQWAGFNIPSQKINAWVCPTFHPSYLLHEDEPFLDRLFQQHLEAAVAHKGRPWETVPDYRSQVKIILDAKKAARWIEYFIDPDRMSAFDYETNMLKPDSSDRRIISCAISDGETTIAYPWHGAAIEATKRYLVCPAPKVASNQKFEERWSLAELGVRVVGWAWDTMLGGHVIDNRPGVTSVKFQSFILLGADSYDDHIKPFLKSKGSKKVNQVISQINIHDLCLYNGMDALLEMHVARKQMKELCYVA